MLATVSASALNIRSIPSFSGRVLGVITENAVVNVIGIRDNWLEIQYNGSIGFVAKEYMIINSKPSDLQGLINARELNVRDIPSITGSIKGVLTSGTRVKIISHIQNWLEIEFNNDIGYVSHEYVDLFSPFEHYTAEVIANVLNVRASPNQSAPVLGQVMQGMKLKVEADYGDWSEIILNGSRSFVTNKYIRKIKNIYEEYRTKIADDDDDSENVSEPKEIEMQSTVQLQPKHLMQVSGSSTQKKVAMAWNRYGNLLEKLSSEKGIDVGSVVAVLCVESSGKGFEQNNNNRMIIRFENHKFWKYWGRKNPEIFKEHFRYNSEKVWTKHKWRKKSNTRWLSFHGNQFKEWEAFEFARSLDSDSAMLSISMGAPQIMGFHYERIGYRSVEEMFNCFSKDITYQIKGLFDFFSDSMINRLSSKDFEGFAAYYNGSGQKKKYGKWINDHYHSFQQNVC